MTENGALVLQEMAPQYDRKLRLSMTENDASV